MMNLRRVTNLRNLNINIINKLTILIVIVILISYQIRLIDSIYCWQCNSAKDRFCSDVPSEIPEKKEDLDDCFKKMYRECKSENDKLNYTFCRKQVQTIDEETRIIRACGYVRAPQDCYWTKNPPSSTYVCQCDGDGCNHAFNYFNVNYFLLITLPILSILL